MNNNLKKLISAANEFYLGKQLSITDKEYDELLDEVKKIDPSFNIFDHIDISDDDSGRHPIPYRQPIFKEKFETLDYYEHEYLNNYRSHDVYCKYDGSSVSAYYKDGKLLRILSRSDEVEGVDQTNKLRNKVPSEVHPGVVKIDFESLTAVEDFADGCRSKANGLINSKNLQDEVDKYLYLLPFYIEVTPELQESGVNLEERAKLANVILHKLHESGLYDSHVDTKRALVEIDGVKVNNDSLPEKKTFPIDGFVIYDTDCSFRIFKYYYLESVVTTVTNIEWNISDTLSFIPKVIIETVTIGGSRISRVASGGWSNMMEMQCGIGAKVAVIKSGSTIPKILEVIEPSEDYGIMKCPDCGTEFELIGNSYKCGNKHCPTFIKSLRDSFIYCHSQLDRSVKNKYELILEANEDNFNDIISVNFTESSTQERASYVVNGIALSRLNGWQVQKLVEIFDQFIQGKIEISKNDFNFLSNNNYETILYYLDTIIEFINKHYK